MISDHFYVQIYLFPRRKWWRDYVSVDLCLITEFSRSELRAGGGAWEIGMKEVRDVHVILFLAEGSFLSCCCRILATSASVWDGHHGGTPECAFITWEVWEKGFNRMSLLGNAECTNNVSGTSVFPSLSHFLFLWRYTDMYATCHSPLAS